MIQNSPAGGAIDRSSLNATVGRMAAIATALLLVAFLVLSVSRAAFTASTANEANFVTTDGFVTLSDNDQGSALFELTDTSPNSPTTQCIHVQYEGAAETGVNMYTTVGAQATLTDLSPFLDVNVDAIKIADALFDPAQAAPTCTDYDVAKAAGDADALLGSPLGLPVAANVYTGTLGDFPSTYAGGASAFAGPADPVTVATYAFEITVEVQDDSAAADARADWSFTWETQG